MANIPSIEEGDEVADDVNDEEEIDDKDGKESDEECSEEEKERQYPVHVLQRNR